MSDVGKRIVKGASYIFIFSIMAAISGYILRFLLARNLSVKDFGLFYSVFAFVGFFSIFKDLGLGGALIKFVSEYKVKKEFAKIKTSFFYVLMIQLFSVALFTIVIFFINDFLALHYFGDPRAKVVLWFVLGWLIVSVFQDTIFFMLYALQNFFMYSLRNFMKNTVPLVLIVFFLLTKFDYKSPAISFFLGALITTLIMWPILLRNFKFSKYKFVKSFSLAKKLFSFGIPILLASVGGLIIARMDTIMLTFFRSLEEVGVYNIILPTATLLFIFGHASGSVLFPISSELWTLKKKKELRDYNYLIHKYSLIFSLPFLLVLFSFSKLFLRFFFGQEYVAGSIALQILLFGAFFYTLAVINNSILAGIGRPKDITKMFLIASILNLVLNFVLIPILGIVGAAIATSFSYFTIFLFGTIKMSKIITLKFPIKMWLKTLFAGLIFVLIIFLLRKVLELNPWLELIVFSSISIIVYLILIILLRIATIKEFSNLIRKILKR
ncbi:flippase [Candidatus Woesearchaeota archaeon]|nr:flippase [Candidatus Woesearchaeota archaeon]